jgi:regulator of RNase E activity RraA
VAEISSFPRIEPGLVERLARFGAAVLGDAMGRRNCVDDALQARWPGAALAGPAFTVWTREGDNLAVHEALEVTAPGAVLVIAGPGATTRALIGEMIGIKAAARGLAGFVIDGAARDIAELEALGVAVFSRGQTPAGPFKTGPYELLPTVAIGGVVVHPGDAVVGDRDGVVVVPRERAAEVLARAEEIAAGEVAKRAANAVPIR